MGKFTKEEKIILFTIIIAATAGIIIKTAFSYNQKIKNVKIAPEKVAVDINSASCETLQKLPGIGGVYAKRIINYRRENGGFKNPGELINIKGIGKKTYKKMRQYVRVKTPEEIKK